MWCELFWPTIKWERGYGEVLVLSLGLEVKFVSPEKTSEERWPRA